MSILIDTGFFVALINNRDKYHKRAREIIHDLLSGKWGFRITTDYILDEVITLTWARTKNRSFVEKSYQLIIGPKAITMFDETTYKSLKETWMIYQKYVSLKKPLSFTDCSLIAFARRHSINHILSFAKEFDGIEGLQRIY